MMEYTGTDAWVGTPILGAFEARKAEEMDLSWAVHLAEGETEQDMRRRWLEYHLDVQGGRCAYCGVEISIFRTDGEHFLYATVDHIVPLSKGGPDVVENTLGACRRCNFAKRSADLEDFLISPDFQESVSLNHPCPDRVCGDPASVHFNLDALRRGVRVWIDGTEFRMVYAYCVSEGTAEIAIPNTRTRTGKRMTLKKRGVITPMFRDVKDAVDRIEAGSFREELLSWLSGREIPAAVRVRNSAIS